MEDHFEITITINEDSFPLLFEYLKKVSAGRRRAAAFKRLAENFLLLQRQSTMSSSAAIQTNDNVALQNPSMDDHIGRPTDSPIDQKYMRQSLHQFDTE